MTPLRAAFADELVKLAAYPKSMLTPQSSNVRGYTYDPASQDLLVTYKNGGTYRYTGVDQKTAKAIGRNKSVGKSIHRLIKTPGVPYEKVGSSIVELLPDFMKRPAEGTKQKKKVTISPAPAMLTGALMGASTGGFLGATTYPGIRAYLDSRHAAPPPGRMRRLLSSPLSDVAAAREAMKRHAVRSAHGYAGGTVLGGALGALGAALIINQVKREMNKEAGRMSRMFTLPVVPLPNRKDPIWRLGHDKVKLIAEYLDDLSRSEPRIPIPVTPLKKVASPGYVRILAEKDGAKLEHHYLRKGEWGAPAGKIEDGESPADAAMRELIERTGYAAKKVTPEGVDGDFHVFRAHDVHQVGDPQTEIRWEKTANGDMLDYFRKHPQKLKEKQERDRRDPPKWKREAIARGLMKKKAFAQTSGDAAASVAASMIGLRRSIEKRAGVCKKTITWNGIPLKIEHEPGDIRSGVSKDGKEWSRKMEDHYGYVAGTKGMGADGDAVDVYFAAQPVDNAGVYRVRQIKKDGEFDEDKYMLGFGSAHEAKDCFMRHMPEWAFGGLSTVSEAS